MSGKRIHSLRIAYDISKNEEKFLELLQILKRFDTSIYRLSLFTTTTHAPLTLQEAENRMKILKKRIKTAEEFGFSTGINILTTIGHHEEDLENSLQGPYFNMTGAEGGICRGSFCMNDPRFLEEYVRPLYKMTAEASPEHIWIDDDVRYGHMPIGNGCFCQGCIDKFNKENGTDLSRESLLDQLSRGNMNIRRAWLRHNGKAIVNLFKIIAETVRAVDPKIKLGFMTGERYFESYDFKAFADALSEKGKYGIMWRPGGGAYTDYRFDEIVEKTEEIGRQTAYLPEYVTEIHSEIENFPYQLIKKTPTSTALEGAMTMTSGCTGAAFNIVPSESGEPAETVIPHLKAIERLTPFYEILAEKTGGKQPCGICTGWRPDSQLAVPEGPFHQSYGGMYANFARELFDFGLPQCYRAENASVSVVTGQFAAHWTDDEIKELLSKGVYMNVSALDFLNSKGFENLTAFKALEKIPVDATERYTGNPLNKGLEGSLRNCRQAFNFGDSFALSPLNPKCEILSETVDYHGKTLGNCSLGLFENEVGGLVCVGGYYPFTWISDYNKTAQLKRLMVRLSKNTLPSYVETYCRIRNHTFVLGDKITVTLCNPTNELLENVKVAVRTESSMGEHFKTDGSRHMVSGVDSEYPEYRIFTLDKVAPYEMAVLEV